MLALDDPDVVAAVRFIRANSHRALSIAHVADAVAMARRSLERRFRQQLQRTVGAEIARVHFERAKQLFIGTDLSIPKVAAASGYGSPEYLAAAFRRSTGLSPLKYRMQVRGR